MRKLSALEQLGLVARREGGYALAAPPGSTPGPQP
jgi:hypothetical protein